MNEDQEKKGGARQVGHGWPALSGPRSETCGLSVSHRGRREASDRTRKGGTTHNSAERMARSMLDGSPPCSPQIPISRSFDLPAFLDTHPHELTDAFAIQRLDG